MIPTIGALSVTLRTNRYAGCRRHIQPLTGKDDDTAATFDSSDSNLRLRVATPNFATAGPSGIPSKQISQLSRRRLSPSRKLLREGEGGWLLVYEASRMSKQRRYCTVAVFLGNVTIMQVGTFQDTKEQSSYEIGVGGQQRHEYSGECILYCMYENMENLVTISCTSWVCQLLPCVLPHQSYTSGGGEHCRQLTDQNSKQVSQVVQMKCSILQTGCYR